MEIKVGWPGLDELCLKLGLDDDQKIISCELSGIGGPELLNLLADWRGRFKGALQSVALPEGHSPAHLLFRELILRAQGKWDYPYKDDELCHCRAIPTQKVDQAIVYGAHKAEKVSRLTSASTACGTCRPDVQSILNYRLRLGSTGN